jgi:short-subunit dehydrogenase
MVERGIGRLLFTSSTTAAMPGPYEATYAASKAFVFSFAEAIRYELRDTGVTVTTLLPGPTETHFFERAGLTDTKVGAGRKDDPAEVARAGFDALLAGKDHVVAGALRNRVQMLAARTMPPAAAAALHGRMSQPGSAPLV